MISTGRSAPPSDFVTGICDHAFYFLQIYRPRRGHDFATIQLFQLGTGMTSLPLPSAQPLHGDPKRQAVATIEAYDYQIWRTLEQWLQLGPDDQLYLEGAEDFDVCGPSQSHANQVKHSPTDISLASKDVQGAIHNYWKLVQDNANVPGLKLRFLTRGGVRLERPSRFGGRKGLDVWASAAAGNDEDALLLAKELPKLLEPQESGLAAFLTSASPSVLRERLFTRIDWVVNEPHIDQTIEIVERMILKYGQSLGYPADRSLMAVGHLVRYCYKTVRLVPFELRSLTRLDLRDQFLDATAIKLPFTSDVAKLLAQRLSSETESGGRLDGLWRWLAASPLLSWRRWKRQASFSKIDRRNPAYEAALSGLMMARLELGHTGPICFQGRQSDAIVPALCLWAESASLGEVPGLVLVDTKASAVQDTVLWSGAVKLGLETRFHECLYVDARSENIAMALSTSARNWRDSLLSALPLAVHERLEHSGFAHLLEQTINATALRRDDGDAYRVFGRAVEEALSFLCMSEPVLPPQLRKDSGQDDDVSLRMDYESYMDRQCPADVGQLKELKAQLARKSIDQGLIVAQESQQCPAIVLFDSAQPASVVLASVIHSLYYWRYVGRELCAQKIHTRPVLYFSDAVGVPVARFIVQSFGSNTCIVNGPAPAVKDQWPNNHPDRAHLVQVEADSFVYAGRRVQFKSL